MKSSAPHCAITDFKFGRSAVVVSEYDVQDRRAIIRRKKRGMVQVQRFEPAIDLDTCWGLLIIRSAFGAFRPP